MSSQAALSAGVPTSSVATRLSPMLTSKEVARLLNVAPSTLCRWRQTGKGPRVYWLGDGTPRYREDDLLEWLERMAA